MSTPVVIVLIVVAGGLLVGGMAAVRARSNRDGVDSFRRQIDALSPEARRPVIDQVQNVVERSNGHPSTDEADGDEINEDGARGT